MSSDGGGFDTRFMSPAQLEIAGRLGFQTSRLSSFTPIVLGAYVDAICLGVMSVLFVRWCLEARANEGRLIRYLVYWECLVAGAGTTAWLQGHIMTLFAKGFGEYRHFLSVAWLRWGGLPAVFSRIPASCFFLHRAYLLCNRSIWPVVVIVPLLIAMTGGGLATVFKQDRLPITPALRRISLATSSMDAIHDVILTTTIAVQLFRSKTGWAGTDRLVHKLLIYVAETQTPPTVMAIAFLVVVLVWPDSTGALLLLFYPKIIGICVLAVLLSRVKMREQQLNSNLQSKSLRSGLTGRSKTVGGGRTNVGVSAFAPASLSRGVDQPVVDENASEANLIRSERM